MAEQAPPDAEAIEAVLAARPDVWAAGTRVLSVRDLSPGLGQAAVLQVSSSAPDGRRAEWIVKIPAWGNQSLLESQDDQLDRREVRFFGSDLPGLLPRGLATPPDATVVSHSGVDWIVMRDIGIALNHPWTPASAATAAQRIALLSVPGALHPELLDAPWLEHEGHAAYAHHIPAAHDNLDALTHDPQLKQLFTPRQVHALHACLDAAAELGSRAARLSATLIHGDLTTSQRRCPPRQHPRTHRLGARRRRAPGLRPRHFRIPLPCLRRAGRTGRAGPPQGLRTHPKPVRRHRSAP